MALPPLSTSSSSAALRSCAPRPTARRAETRTLWIDVCANPETSDPHRTRGYTARIIPILNCSGKLSIRTLLMAAVKVLTRDCCTGFLQGPHCTSTPRSRV
eukprot:2019278-Amphidinium_carterae.1